MLEQTIAVLIGLLAISIVLERSLHFIFRFAWYRKFFANKGNKPTPKATKALIALAISMWVCFQYDFDAFARIIVPSKHGHGTEVGYILTALIIAGGSSGIKIALKNLRDLFESRA